MILREGALIGWLVVCIYLLIALFSFSANDPGFSHTGSRDMVSNAAGPTGAWLADVLFWLFGIMAYMFPLLLIWRAWRVFRSKRDDQQPPFDWLTFAQRCLGLVLVMLSATALTDLHYGTVSSTLPEGLGGVMGAGVAQVAVSAFSVVGSTLVLLAVALFGLTIFADISWLALIDGLGRISLLSYDWLRSRVVEMRNNRQEARQASEAQQARKEKVAKKVKAAEKRIPPSIQMPASPAKTATSKRAVKEKQTTLFEEPLTGTLPAIGLLDLADDNSGKGFSKESLEAMSRLLELKLQDFGISAEVVEVMPGPVITRFEIQPAPGVKASRITNLAKDLARSLAVVSVRVVEVIPGKSVMGIEIPNEHREMVRLSEVVSSEVYEDAKSPLTLALGNDISGVPTVADLAKMPHLLVAGTTGSGKSVGINAMLLSLLFKSSPEEVRLILVDPKMLELSVYDGIPHLLTPVITDMKDAANGLRWCVGEMERRYKLMAAMGVRNISGFNKKVKDAAAAGEPIADPLWQPDPYASAFEEDIPQEAPSLEALPYIVVVIDEFADMMMIVGKKVEQLIARIAQKARAAGIHLILATQRPSVDVITGLIKANVPSRIAFQVSSKIDSRTILDQGGAEQLLGHGDMLYLPPGSGVPVRVHGAFVDDHEVHKVVADWKRRGEPEYLDEILDEGVTNTIAVPGFATEGEGDGNDETDALYDEAVNFVLESRKASISAVQRKLRIGYNRAARLIETMEAAGVVSAMGSNGSREVLAPGGRD
ncbi:DNA translocase FtsK 4TM domain-containing protein [Porticoccus sp. W117]|uniref:DNA translocase FtsK n=1 Tax=Porticoccus sp. W117 TaxID=3054777 RepID=UPI0025992DFA|nr:DNA translocase FtsK [Porticoccus sp. W117]MDM3871948.1 DNA translocase FtsK 4TM domain-containing protein [Porticoccus sp. W117]